MKYRAYVALTLLMGVSTPSGYVYGQTLEEAMTMAYNSNPTLLAERARLRATDEGVPQALSDWRPTVELSGDVAKSANFSNTSTGVNRRQHRDPVSVAFTVTQSLFRGGRTLAATRGAENTVKAQRASLLSSEQSVLLDAVEAYMNVFRDQAVIELNINNEQVLKRQLQATRDRFEVGEITRTDVHQAEARLARATADRIKAEGDLDASRAVYRSVIGEYPEKLNLPDRAMDLSGDAEAAVKAAVSDNPSVIKAIFDEKASLDNIDEVWGELLPSVDLTGKASRSFEASSETSRADTYEAKLSLTIPLYQSGAVYSRLREARQLAAEKRLKIDQAQRTATEKATKAWESLKTARARIKSFQTQVKAAEVALDGVQREAAVGSRTVLDVLDAEQELLDAKVSYVRAQRDEVLTYFQLKEAMGRLTAAKMDLPVNSYDPQSHYREVRSKWFGGSSSGEGTPIKAVGAKTK